jgi:hypothetical protein
MLFLLDKGMTEALDNLLIVYTSSGLLSQRRTAQNRPSQVNPFYLNQFELTLTFPCRRWTLRCVGMPSAVLYLQQRLFDHDCAIYR